MQFPFNEVVYSLQPTAKLKPPLQMHFSKCSEGKGCSQVDVLKF